MCVVLIQLRKQTIVCDFLIINSTKIILIFHDFNKFLMKYLANAKKKKSWSFLIITHRINLNKYGK